VSEDAWSVAPEAAGERLDRHVAERLGLPRNQIQRWIRDGLVRLGGKPSRPSTPVATGDLVECTRPEPRDDRIVPEAGDLPLLYEDDQVVVIDKPPGLTVHPGAGRDTGTLAHRLLDRYPEMTGVGGPGRPGIVHRLDQGTSGVMVVARTPEAYARLSKAFAERQVEKRYLALVYGTPSPPAGVIESPIGRHPQRRQEMAIRPGGRPAHTDYRTVASGNGIALLEIGLGTGRTHQIRVHMKSLGHPLVGDPVYGEARWKALPRPAQFPLRDFPRPALHAWRLAFEHPKDGRRLTFGAPVPDDLRELWEGATGTAWPVPEEK
jgi:23S rRNA pseudouridine1911/1915/1917 synthase